MSLTAKQRRSLPMLLRATLGIALLISGAAASAASTDANGNSLDSVIAAPVAFGSQDASGNTLNAVLPGAFAVLSAAPDGTRLTIGTLLDQGEPTGEGEGEGEGTPDGEGEGTVDGEGEGEGNADGEGEGEGGAEGEVDPQICEIILSPLADVTLYNNAVNPGEFANGAGQRLFAGTTGNGAERRALLHFDAAGALPADATVLGVELRLTMDKGATDDPVNVSAFRLTNGFSGGPTDPPDSGNGDGEGNGAQAVTGDSTWLHTSYNTETWIAAGGDFAASASRTVSLAGNGEYNWTGAGMIADVQAWVDGTFPEFGWILVGDEGANSTVKRFLSEESADPEFRPLLIVRYTTAEPCESAEGEGEDGDPYVALLFAFASADTDSSAKVTLEEILFQFPDFTQGLLNAADANDDNELSVAELLEFSNSGVVHSADINGNFVLSLSELLRGIQLYNAGGYACAANAGATEDGYEARAPLGGDPGCVLHALDQNLNQSISLSELLRGIQLFSFQGHFFCDGQSEDNFCERP